MRNAKQTAAAFSHLVDRRRLVTVLLALVATSLLTLQATSFVQADGVRGVNGTVMSVGATSMRVAIKSGLINIYVDADTDIKNGKVEIELSDIKPGDKISARVVTLADSQLLASKIKVRGKSSVTQIQHLTGVVIERGENSFRLTSRNGRSIEIELEQGAEPPAVADVVTTIVENDLATGRVKAKQIERIEKIVARLENSLSKQVDRAKANVLKRIIDESARQHLDTLNQTLDQVEDEAREKIEAALEKFRTDYAGVAQRVGNAAPEESYQGVIAEITSSSLRISSTTGDGSRNFAISAETGILIEGVENASTADLVLGQSVTVAFVPAIDGSDADPVALVIEAVPPALPPVVAEAIEDLSEDVVQGDIAVVEEQEEPGSTVVIIEETDSGDTVGVEVTPETVITIDGESGTTADLQTDQQVEVTVEENGVTADSVVVTTTPPASTEESISGVVTAVDPIRRVIVIAPAAGDPIRLTVAADVVATVDGALVTLDELQVQDMVLDTSKYLPDEGVATRLAVVRPAAIEPPAQGDGESSTPEDPGSQEQGTGGTEPSGPTPFSIRGFLKSFDGDVIVFDGMTMPKSAGFALPEGISAGSEVDLVFAIAADGSVVLTGIQAP